MKRFNRGGASHDHIHPTQTSAPPLSVQHQPLSLMSVLLLYKPPTTLQRPFSVTKIKTPFNSCAYGISYSVHTTPKTALQMKTVKEKCPPNDSLAIRHLFPPSPFTTTREKQKERKKLHASVLCVRNPASIQNEGFRHKDDRKTGQNKSYSVCILRMRPL